MPDWLEEREYCEGLENIKYKKCDNWAFGNVNDCKDNAPAGTVGWQACGIGSSPGGKEPGHTAAACSERTDDFKCAWGQNCFAITGKSKDTKCDPTSFEEDKNICDIYSTGITYSKCSNWANNDPNSCNQSSKKPSDIIGWIPCAIGSDPTTTSCSPYSTEFNCKWGQDCFAVKKYDTSSSGCDPTKYEPLVSEQCDTAGNKLSYQKCVSWKNNDPNSCNQSSKKSSSVTGWITCAVGSDPSTINCSPYSTDFNCKVGQECFAVTSLKTDESCEKSVLVKVQETTENIVKTLAAGGSDIYLYGIIGLIVLFLLLIIF